MDNISKHVSWKEATHSNTAVSNNIQNIPSTQELEAMKIPVVHNHSEYGLKWHTVNDIINHIKKQKILLNIN